MLYSWEDMCFQIDRICYHLHCNIGISKLLLPSSVQNSGLIYHEQENNHNKYCMYNGYLYIEPCRLAHGCIGWEYLLVVLNAIYKRKLKHILYRNALSLN